jgi:hypothetical protein
MIARKHETGINVVSVCRLVMAALSQIGRVRRLLDAPAHERMDGLVSDDGLGAATGHRIYLLERGSRESTVKAPDPTVIVFRSKNTGVSRRCYRADVGRDF